MRKQKNIKMIDGFQYWPNALSSSSQKSLLLELIAIIDEAPFFRPTMPRTGKPFSVEMTNCGSLGWISDKDRGYRYQSRHPETGNLWPPMPEMLMQIWQELTQMPGRPEACLINHYRAGAKMGLHRDQDENEPRAPVLSLSLGDAADFRIGGARRQDPTETIELKSGDIVILGGKARHAYHGISRIFPGTSSLIDDRSSPAIKDGGRLNVTLRRVHPFQ